MLIIGSASRDPKGRHPTFLFSYILFSDYKFHIFLSFLYLSIGLQEFLDNFVKINSNWTLILIRFKLQYKVRQADIVTIFIFIL